MKVVTWNVYSKNKNQTSDIHTVLSQDVDILCLQEVSEKTKKYLEEQDTYHCSFAIDHYLNKDIYYNVIISTHKPHNSQTLPFHIKTHQTIVPKLIGAHEGIEYQYNDYSYNGESVRVFNTHLACLYPPIHRKNQLTEICHHFHTNNYT